MMRSGDLIGRTSERARLATALADAAAGDGSLLLVAGDAGVGKTRLIESALDAGEARVVRGAALPSGSAYGPIVAAFRSFLRMRPAGLESCGPLRGHLAQLLPELGTPVPSADRAALVEAIRCAFVSMTADGPVAVLLDDLQWSDEATLELLVSLNPSLRELPLLVVCAYRADEVSRTHPVRRLRHDLRRERSLREVVLDPFDEAETGELLGAVLGELPSPQLVRMLHERTGGMPFFVEALAEALLDEGRLERADDGMYVTLDGEMPLPPTVRDAVLVRTGSLSDAARAAAELASVAGMRFDVGLLAGAGEDGLSELFANGLVVEDEPGVATFRHALVRDALYDDIPWLRRRDLHRRIAAELAQSGAPGGEVAAHRLAARDVLPGLDALVTAIQERAAVHAYRDAVRLGRQALDLWPEGERASQRITVLEDHARHSELAGDLAEAGRAQREVVTARRADGAGRALADAERRLAAIYALQGDRRRALAARRVAAEAYAANGLPGEAAAERLVIAGYLQSSGDHTEAVAVAREARAEALAAERTDLQARAMGLEGVALTKAGISMDGMSTIRDGLSLALGHGHSVEAAEVYQRLGTAHEITGDYGRAKEALGTAIGICERSEDAGLEYTCLSCLAYVLRELGEWNQAEELCERLVAPGAPAHDTLVADGILGAMRAWRGRFRDALPPLMRSLETSARLDVVSMQCDSAAALAWLSAHTGDRDRATDYCRVLLDRWARSEDHHYAVWALRWATAWLSDCGEVHLARGCADALSRIAQAGHPDAQAALASALAETAFEDGHADVAAEQFALAVEIHRGLEIPFERADILLRSSRALDAAGDRDAAIVNLVEAYRIAQRLGAAPLAAAAADQVGQLGESIERHLGRRAAADFETAGLSRREVEVVRLVAEGLTNREIAARLVLSTRTVDMHVRNILGKLGARTRTEAVTQAANRGLFEPDRGERPQ